MNKVEEWPLGQLVLKTHHLQYLKLADLEYTTADNKTQLLEFAAQVVTFSCCLDTLYIENSSTSAADGDRFMQTIVDSDFDWLQNLTIAGERRWFQGGRDECMGSLVPFIEKQKELKFIDLGDNAFTEEQ